MEYCRVNILVFLYHMTKINQIQGMSIQETTTIVSTATRLDDTRVTDLMDDVSPSTRTLSVNTDFHINVSANKYTTDNDSRTVSLHTHTMPDKQSISVIYTRITSPLLPTQTSTEKAFYHRGTLVKTHTKIIHPKTGTSSRFKPASVVHREWMNKLRNMTGDNCYPDCSNETSPSRRKAVDAVHSTNLLHSIRGKQNKSPHLFTWIIASAAVAVGFLSILGASFLICYCMDKVRKRREEARRRRFDKSGEYERVDSVSSIVSHNDVYDDNIDLPIDDITII